jgi:hypothetical protein
MLPSKKKQKEKEDCDNVTEYKPKKQENKMQYRKTKDKVIL